MQHVPLQRSNRKTDIDLNCQSSFGNRALPVIVSDLNNNMADTGGDVWFDSVKPDLDVTVSLSTPVENDRSLRLDASDREADAPLWDDIVSMTVFGLTLWMPVLCSMPPSVNVMYR